MASSPPSQDAIASLITQVSPTGQPARAPSRPVRPRQGQAKKGPTNGAKKATTTGAGAAASADKPKENTTSTTSAAANDAGEVAPAPATAAATVQLADDSSAARGDSTYGTEETAAGSTSESSTKPLTAVSTATMHPASSSVHTSTPPSTGQSTKQRPSSQDITSTSPKLSSSQQANKPKHLQKEAPHVSGAAGSSSSASLQKKKAKRKSWISSLFSSCFTGGAGHDDDGEHSNNSNAQMTERKAGTANATRNVKPAPTTVGTSTSTSTATPNTTSAHTQDSKHANMNKDVAMVPLTKGVDKNDSTSKLTRPTESTDGTGTTSSRDVVSQPLPDSTSQSNIGGGALLLPLSASTASGLGSGSSPKSEIAPEILAANQPGGTPLSRDETGDVLSGAVQAPGSEGLTPKKEKRRKSSSGERSTDGAAGGDTSRVSSLHDESGNEEAVEDSEAEEEEEEEEEYVDEEERIIAAGGMGIPIDEDGNPAPLLKELTPAYKGKKCLVLDLDETLVHSSFKLIHSPDFVVPVEIENTVHNVYVIKRPGVDAFMKRMGELYEVVVFTASLSKYADPVLDQLDIHRVVEHRLFRESCYNHRGNYVKDLSQLGREIGDTIIIDNSPASYIFHPNNAVPVSSWFNDPHDTELTDLQGFLADLAEVPDVRGVLDGGLFPIQ